MRANQGRFKTTISPMPSNTPGRRKGSHVSQPTRELNELPGLHELHERLRAPAARPRATTAVAEAAAREKEFQRASWLASRAPGSSVQGRLTDISWKTGRPTERRQSKKVQPPHSQNQPRSEEHTSELQSLRHL